MKARILYHQRSPSDQLAARRTAVRKVLRGESITETAAFYGVSRQTVHAWIQAYKEDPQHGLESGKRGRPPALTPPQRERLAEILVEGPLAHGWETNLWTCGRIRDLIQQVFGASYHEASVSRLLRKSLRFSWQKPMRRARERDGEKNRDVCPPDLPESEAESPASGHDARVRR